MKQTGKCRLWQIVSRSCLTAALDAVLTYRKNCGKCPFARVIIDRACAISSIRILSSSGSKVLKSTFENVVRQSFSSVLPHITRIHQRCMAYVNLYQLSTSWPSSVTRTMISHCADGIPSSVYTSQSFSSSMKISTPPMLTIGSMVKIIPGASTIWVPRLEL